MYVEKSYIKQDNVPYQSSTRLETPELKFVQSVTVETRLVNCQVEYGSVKRSMTDKHPCVGRSGPG